MADCVSVKILASQLADQNKQCFGPVGDLVAMVLSDNSWVELKIISVVCGLLFL